MLDSGWRCPLNISVERIAKAMVAAGYILVVVGCIVCLIGEIRMLALAYRRGFGWLLCCLLLAPLCWLALLAADFKSTARPFALAVLGMVVAAFGGSMAGIGDWPSL